jgi:signal transduction histidine kinase
LDNALKYGGSAEISATVASNELRIRIRDHGPGIPADKLDTVFEPFVRLEIPDSRPTDGAGLGLTIARMLAQKNEAHLLLDNHPEGGLEACLILRRGLAPARACAEWAATQAGADAAGRLNRPTGFESRISLDMGKIDV